MELLSFSKENYQDYRLKIIFDGYKWDPQFSDNNTIAPHYLVLNEKEHELLVDLVEKLGKETEAAENYLYQNPTLLKDLKLPYKIKNAVRKLANYKAEDHLRLMRFDFHPLKDGTWSISEVNSDVPGGFAESSYMPEIALSYLKEDYKHFNFIDEMILELSKKITSNSKIMLVHCTSYSDDRQVMQALGDKLVKKGYQVIYGAADHLSFKDNKAYSILSNNETLIDAIIRFNPIEWVVSIKPKNWQGYFDTKTYSCNHPIAVITQSKSFPLIWDDLEKKGINLKTWRKLLPDTIRINELKNQEGYIYKPIWGRVGEGISIKEATRIDEYEKILKDVKKHPRKYIAQKKFDSLALKDEFGKSYHLSLGVYYLNGNFAGYYGRINNLPRIDSNAAELPVFVKENDHES